MNFSENEVIQSLNQRTKNTLMETLDIKYTEYKNGTLVAEMPVNQKVHQPFGILHGGATIALIETVGSVVSFFQFPKPDDYLSFGTQLSVSHLNSVKSGKIIASAKVKKAGNSIHVVQVEVVDEDGKLISIATQTNSIKVKK